MKTIMLIVRPCVIGVYIFICTMSVMVGNTTSTRAFIDDNDVVRHDTAFTQNTITQNIATKALYLELLGSAGLYAFCYDMPVADGVSFRIGLSGLNGNKGGRTISIFMSPILLLHTIGTTHQMEIGAGIVPSIVNGIPGVVSDNASLISGFNLILPVSAYPANERISAFRISSVIGVLGYRYMPFDHGVMWKISLMPVFVDSSLRPYFSLGIGYAW